MSKLKSAGCDSISFLKNLKCLLKWLLPDYAPRDWNDIYFLNGTFSVKSEVTGIR